MPMAPGLPETRAAVLTTEIAPEITPVSADVAPTVSDGRHARAGGPTCRLLVTRTSRPAQFAKAVRLARARYPDAEIVALSHSGHEESLRAAGVDRLLELRGSRFGIASLSLRLIRRLRAERFHEVVIPQMSRDPIAHGNVYRVAVLVRSTFVTVVAPGGPPRTVTQRALRREVVHNLPYELLAKFQSPFFLFAVLAAACLSPRRRSRRRKERRQGVPGDTARPRVLHIIGSLGVGGAQRQLAEVINSTSPDRFDVHLLVMEPAGGEFSRQWFTRDVTVHYLTQWPRLVSTVLEITRFCRRGRYDIVHTWLFLANVVGAAGARLAGVPCIVASVRSLSLWKRTLYPQWWFRLADTLGSRAADVVTVNAEALAADHAEWARYPRARMAVVHNGLDPARLTFDADAQRAALRARAGLSTSARVIGIVGRLAIEKDHSTFLRVLQRIRRIHPDVHGVVVGDGDCRRALEAEAQALALGDGVVFLGECPDACGLIAGCDAILLTSILEGFPNVLLEAVFLGVPAVATRVGGCPDVLSDAGALFEPGDVETAARMLLDTLEAPIEAARRAEALRARALRQFTAARTAARWFEIYDQLLWPRRACCETSTRRPALLSRLQG